MKYKAILEHEIKILSSDILKIKLNLTFVKTLQGIVRRIYVRIHTKPCRTYMDLTK